MRVDNTKINVGLVQIGDSFGGQYYLPYSIGLLQAYAQKHLKNSHDFSFMIPVYKSMPIEEAMDHLSEADIIFFSTYQWNYRISLEIAKGLKSIGECVVVFGGPMVPESPVRLENFLREYPFINIGSYGEGEIPFLKILENTVERKWENVPSIGFLAPDSRFTYNARSVRILNLNEIPSPYLDGTFEPLLRANPQLQWSALIETNRGCPYACSFCYWGDITRNKLSRYGLERTFGEIDWFSQKKIEFVFCCDSNFGILQRDNDIALKVAENKKKFGYPKAFSIQNAKNSTAKILQLQQLLNDSGLQKGVNLALQSVNQDTLKSINRSNIQMRVFEELQRDFTKKGISTFTDMIIALPEESYGTFTDGVSRVIENGQHNRIQFINLTVLENTEMSDPEYIQKYGMILQESQIVPHHSSISKNEHKIFETHNLVVGTNTMPKEDWIKTKVFCWVISLLFFNKLLHIPLLLISKLHSLSFRELIELFVAEKRDHDEMRRIVEFFVEKAKDIQEGRVDQIASEDWLGIWWPPDEYVFVDLCVSGRLAKFYEEAESALSEYLRTKSIDFSAQFLRDAIQLNRNLLKLPFVDSDLELSCSYNVFDVYQGALRAEHVQVLRTESHYVVDRSSEKWNSWEDWLRQVVWYGTKKGAYMYQCTKKSLIAHGGLLND